MEEGNFDQASGVVDILQQISLIKCPRSARMSSPPSSPLTRHAHHTAQPGRHPRRPHLPAGHAALHRHSSLRPPLSDHSDSSPCSEPQRQTRRPWSQEEQRRLVWAFGEVGASWEELALRLDDRDAPEIKRHFAKILRKVIQNLNRTHTHHQQPEIRYARIARALRAATHRPRNQPAPNRQPTIITEIHLLLQQWTVEQEEGGIGSSEALHQRALSLLLALKRTRKKHSNKASTGVLFKFEVESEQRERGYASDSSSVFEEQEEEQEECSHLRHQPFFAEEAGLESEEVEPVGLRGVVVKESEEEIKDLLRESGVLEVQEVALSCKGTANCQESIASSSENLNNESYQHFYEESELERDCYWKKSCSDLRNID